MNDTIAINIICLTIQLYITVSQQMAILIKVIELILRLHVIQPIRNNIMNIIAVNKVIPVITNLMPTNV